MASPTLAQMQTDYETVLAKLQALYDAPDIESGSPGGGTIRIQRQGQIAFLERRLLLLQAQISIQGGVVSSEPRRPGIDVERASDNGDLP
jgi:hypothetical protein